MSILITISSVVFVILCALLVIIILLQSDKSAGMGILGGGSSQSAFGSSTADIITKITTVLVALFMLGSLGLAILESWKERSIEEGLLSEEKRAPGVIEKTELPEKGAEKDKRGMSEKKK
jgi:preprotein translocase subunit SecG